MPVLWALPQWLPSFVPLLGLLLPIPMLLNLISFCILLVIVPPA